MDQFSRRTGLVQISKLASALRLVGRAVSANLGILDEAKKLPKKENLVPVYMISKQFVWLWLTASGGGALIKVTHKGVKKLAGQVGWPEASEGILFQGQLDPYAYSGPEDLLPWDSAVVAPKTDPVPASAATGDLFATGTVNPWMYPPNFKPTTGFVQVVKLDKGSKKTLDGVVGKWLAADGTEQAAVQNKDSGNIIAMPSGDKLWLRKVNGLGLEGKVWKSLKPHIPHALPTAFEPSSAIAPYIGMYQTGGSWVPGQFLPEKNQIVGAGGAVLWPAGSAAPKSVLAPSAAPVAAVPDVAPTKPTVPLAFGPKLEYPIPPNFLRDSTKGWLLYDGVYEGLPGKWLDMASPGGMDAFITANGEVRSVAYPASKPKWSANDVGVLKLLGALQSAASWDAGVPKSLWGKLPKGFRPSQFYPDDLGSILGMYAGKAAYVNLDNKTLNYAGTAYPVAFVPGLALGELPPPASPQAAPSPDMEASAEFAFGWPIPPNFLPKLPIKVELTDLVPGFPQRHKIAGQWYGMAGSYLKPKLDHVPDAYFDESGSVVDAGTGEIYLDLTDDDVKKNVSYAAQVTLPVPQWFKSSWLKTRGGVLLGMMGGMPHMMHVDNGTFMKLTPAGGGIWKSSTETGAAAMGVSFDDIKKSLEPSTPQIPAYWGTPAPEGWDWPIPPNFKNLSPAKQSVKLPNGDSVFGLVGLWQEPGGPKAAVFAFSGKIFNIETGHPLWVPVEAGMLVGEPPASTVWPKLKPNKSEVQFPSGFVSSTTVMGPGGYLGKYKTDDMPVAMVAMFKPASSEIYLYSDAGVLHSKVGLGVGAKPAVSEPEESAWKLTYPPNFVPDGTPKKALPFLLGGAVGIKGLWYEPGEGQQEAAQSETGNIFAVSKNSKVTTRWMPAYAGLASKSTGPFPILKQETGEPFPAGFVSAMAKPSKITGAYPGMVGKNPAEYEPNSKELVIYDAVSGEQTSSQIVGAFDAVPAELDEPKATVTAKPVVDLLPGIVQSIPDAAGLTLVGSGASLGGAGEKDIYKDSTGKQFLFKPAYAKNSKKVEPFRAMAQEICAGIATSVRSDHIPVQTKKIGGVVGTVQPMVALGDPPTLGSGSLAKLSPQEKTDLATDHIVDWVSSQHDTHKNNVLRTKDGRLLTVDKEQGFKYFPGDKLSVDYHPNAAYGESEPVYNTFWREWTEKKIDFDPALLASVVDKISAFDSAAYVAQLEKYAEASPVLNSALKRHNFVNAALARRLNARRDFEKFFTTLYEKRTGEKGEFTFESGWVSEANISKVKFKSVAFTGTTLADELSIKHTGSTSYDYQPDPTKKLLKVTKETPSSKLLEFATDLGLEVFPWPNGENVMTGSMYHIIIVDKAAFAAASKTKQVPVAESFEHTAPKAKYWPDSVQDRLADINTHELKTAGAGKLSVAGKRVALDSGVVEGQVCRVKRVKNAGGTHLSVSMKLLKSQWEKIVASPKMEEATYTFYEGTYDPEIDALVETTSKVDKCSAKYAKVGAIEGWISTDDHKYCYMGFLFLKIHDGSDAHAAMEKWLSAVAPKYVAEILKTPTPEDLELVKLRRILWAVAPKTHRNLKESDIKIGKLKEILAGVGVDESYVRDVELTEVLPGFQSYVKPGQWKKLAGGKLKYGFHGIGSLAGALGILQTGLLGINERNLAGIEEVGKSYDSDVKSGSGDGILLRIITESGFPSSFSGHIFYGVGEYQAIVHPSVFDRLDAYAYGSDVYGVCREDSTTWQGRASLDHQLSKQQANFHGGAEASFRKGIAHDKILRVTCQTETSRKALILGLQAAGVASMNGVPVADFVVVCTNVGVCYERYVKPLGV